MCIHVKNKETFIKIPTSCTATEPFPAQSWHGFWLILSSYCQNSNSSHHFLSCLSSHFANVCQIDFLQIPLWVKLGAISQNTEYNFIWKGYQLSNFYSESRSCFHLPLTRHITIGVFFPPSPLSFFFLFNNGFMLPRLPINRFSFSTFEYISDILCKIHYYCEE